MPHAVFLQVFNAGSRYGIKDQIRVYELMGSLFDSLYRTCCDHKSIVFFKVGYAGGRCLVIDQFC